MRPRAGLHSHVTPGHRVRQMGKTYDRLAPGLGEGKSAAASISTHGEENPPRGIKHRGS
jgi:hypothetical protein